MITDCRDTSSQIIVRKYEASSRPIERYSISRMVIGITQDKMYKALLNSTC